MPPSGPDLAWGGWEENPEESRDNFFKKSNQELVV